MPQTRYIFERVVIAVDCLASGRGSFEERLWDAHTSALAKLDSRDAPAKLKAELAWVLQQCQHYLIPNQGMKELPDPERKRMVSTLMSLLIQSSRLA